MFAINEVSRLAQDEGYNVENLDLLKTSDDVSDSFALVFHYKLKGGIDEDSKNKKVK